MTFSSALEGSEVEQISHDFSWFYLRGSSSSSVAPAADDNNNNNTGSVWADEETAFPELAHQTNREAPDQTRVPLWIIGSLHPATSA